MLYLLNCIKSAMNEHIYVSGFYLVLDGDGDDDVVVQCLMCVVCSVYTIRSECIHIVYLYKQQV